MPIYEYECQECKEVFEEWQKNHEAREHPCPACGGTGKRFISSTAFVLKGGGWYVTDYARKSTNATTGNPATGGSVASGEQAKAQGKAGPKSLAAKAAAAASSSSSSSSS